MLAFVAFPVGFSILAALVTVHLVFLYFAFAYNALIGTWLFLFRCPGCKALVITQGYLMFPYIPRRCRSCGYDLGKRRPGNKH